MTLLKGILIFIIIEKTSKNYLKNGYDTKIKRTMQLGSFIRLKSIILFALILKVFET